MKTKLWALASAACTTAALSLSLVPAWAANKPASPLTVLHTFTDSPDGATPNAGLTKDDAGNMYGTTVNGGTNYNYGTVFKLTPNGSGGSTYNVIYNVGGADLASFPESAPALDSQGNVYVTTVLDGVLGNGAVFELAPAANGSWNLSKTYYFDNSFGGKPSAPVTVDANGNVFGPTHSNFGLSGAIYGAIFELTPSGNTWTGQPIYVFPEDGTAGAYPDTGRLLLDGQGNLYGMTSLGGPGNGGTVFRLHPTANGWVLTTLYAFSYSSSSGNTPFGALAADAAGNLYGATRSGGPSNAGGIFKLSPWPTARGGASANGQWQIDWLYFFTNGTDGGNPLGGVTFDNAGNLYGSTGSGGNLSDCFGAGCGVVFKLTPSASGWSESVLYSFTYGADGNAPWSPPIFDNAGNLYGTTAGGGNGGSGQGGCQGAGCGVVYELTQ